jgi:hypothetical protein
VVHLPDPEREADRLAVDAAIVRTPAHVEGLRASPVPGYVEALRHVMTPLGWKLEDPSGRPRFRKISCELAYPLYGTQALLVRDRS